jgi:hypothetical protein
MAPTLTSWLLQLGNAGAARNAAAACAERRALEARNEAMMRKFTQLPAPRRSRPNPAA